MASAIYSNGNHDAAITATKAAAAGFFVSGSDGVKRVDTAGLLAWLNAQCAMVPSDTGVVDADACNTALAFTDKNGAVASLNNALRPEAFAANPQWPANPGSGIAFSPVAAAQRGLATLRTLGAAITAAWDSLPTDLDKAVTGYFSGSVAGTVTPAVAPITETRTYVFTWVNDWGEESAPCPAADLVTVDQNDTVTVTRPAVPSGRNIVKWRLYRSQASADTALYEFCTELDAGTDTFTDDLVATALGEALPTITWDEPPANLRGLVNMPNGITAAFFDDTICFCEPYYYYAWPVPYRVTLEVPMVAQGAVGQTLIALTRGKPYAVNGSDSSSMVAMKLDADQACVARRSVVSTEKGVIYASPDGICAATPQGVQVLTGPLVFNLFTREDWQDLLPATTFAALAEGTYYFWIGTGDTQQGYALNLARGQLGTVDGQGSAVYFDTPTDALYLASGTAIRALFAGTGYRTGTWRSKRLVMGAPEGFAWVHVESDFLAPVMVRVYCDGDLFFTVDIDSMAPERFPVGRSTEVEIEIETTARVTAVVLAGSTAELKTV